MNQLAQFEKYVSSCALKVITFSKMFFFFALIKRSFVKVLNLLPKITQFPSALFKRVLLAD